MPIGTRTRSRFGVQGSCYPHRENYLEPRSDLYATPTVSRWCASPSTSRDNELQDVRIRHAARRREIAKAVRRRHRRAGRAAQRSPYDARVYQTTHITGGTIMGADPKTSVVSPHLQHWDAQNLFVVGASVYPHNAGYNPTGPLAALALRLGDDLATYTERPRRL